jgi:hypothetical protein
MTKVTPTLTPWTRLRRAFLLNLLRVTAIIGAVVVVCTAFFGTLYLLVVAPIEGVWWAVPLWMILVAALCTVVGVLKNRIWGWLDALVNT